MSRSVISVLQARFIDALYWNPLGYIMTLAMAIFPLWIFADFMANKNSFLEFYNQVERSFKKRWISYTFILIIILLWGWNIYKFI
jgi:hypothetical protein